MNGQLAQRLHDLRRANGLSQEELARKLAVSRQAVSKWECGVTLPDISLLVPLCRVLGLTVQELLEANGIQPEAGVLYCSGDI